MDLRRSHSDKGFTLIEVLVVLSVMAVMTALSLYYIYAQQKLYKPDEQAAYFIDILQEARQKALTQKTTMRVQWDLTKNVARLIDEGGTSTFADDRLVREIYLQASQNVNIEVRPSNVGTSPAEPSPVPQIPFILNSDHPLSLGNKVATVRFRKDGTVTDGSATPIISGATIFIWQPDKENAENSTITRAITIIGGTGAIRLWNYYPNKPTASRWQDSRRFQ